MRLDGGEFGEHDAVAALLRSRGCTMSAVLAAIDELGMFGETIELLSAQYPSSAPPEPVPPVVLKAVPKAVHHNLRDSEQHD